MQDDINAHPPTSVEDETAHAAIPEAGILGRGIVRIGLVFAIGIVLAMLILIQEVLLRYVFNAPTIWAHETTVFLCAMAFIFGGLYCTASDKHIRVVIIYDFIRGRAKRVLDTIISIICMIASAFFAWAAWLMVSRAIFRPDGSVRFETSGSAWDPAYPAYLKLFLLAVLCLLAIQFLVIAMNSLRAAFVTEQTKTEQPS